MFFCSPKPLGGPLILSENVTTNNKTQRQLILHDIVELFNTLPTFCAMGILFRAEKVLEDIYLAKLYVPLGEKSSQLFAANYYHCQLCVCFAL